MNDFLSGAVCSFYFTQVVTFSRAIVRANTFSQTIVFFTDVGKRIFTTMFKHLLLLLFCFLWSETVFSVSPHLVHFLWIPGLLSGWDYNLYLLYGDICKDYIFKTLITHLNFSKDQNVSRLLCMLSDHIWWRGTLGDYVFSYICFYNAICNWNRMIK